MLHINSACVRRSSLLQNMGDFPLRSSVTWSNSRSPSLCGHRSVFKSPFFLEGICWFWSHLGRISVELIFETKDTCFKVLDHCCKVSFDPVTPRYWLREDQSAPTWATISFGDVLQKAWHKLASIFLGTSGPMWPLFFFGGLAFQLMVDWWFGFLGSPYERDCYLGVSLESQTTNPNHQLTISRALMVKKTSLGLGVKGTGREIESHWHPMTPCKSYDHPRESLRSHTPAYKSRFPDFHKPLWSNTAKHEDVLRDRCISMRMQMLQSIELLYIRPKGDVLNCGWSVTPRGFCGWPHFHTFPINCNVWIRTLQEAIICQSYSTA